MTLNNKPEVYINPIILKQSEVMLSSVYPKKKNRWLEGCLSLPRLWGFVDRPYSIDIEYFTPENGELVKKIRTFKDVESSYILHENDHLDGIIFTDRILEQGGTILKETPDGLTPVEL